MKQLPAKVFVVLIAFALCILMCSCGNSNGKFEGTFVEGSEAFIFRDDGTCNYVVHIF